MQTQWQRLLWKKIEKKNNTSTYRDFSSIESVSMRGICKSAMLFEKALLNAIHTHTKKCRFSVKFAWQPKKKFGRSEQHVSHKFLKMHTYVALHWIVIWYPPPKITFDCMWYYCCGQYTFIPFEMFILVSWLKQMKVWNE